MERQKDGRMIPYVRVMHKSQAYVWTQYGCQAIRDLREVAPLFKHERRGKTSWGMAVDTMEMERGEASKILQGAWGKSETSRLYSAVEGVRVNLEVCDDPSKALEFYFSHGNFSHEGRVFSYLDLLTGCDGIPPDLRQRLLEHYQKQRPGMIHPSRSMMPSFRLSRRGILAEYGFSRSALSRLTGPAKRAAPNSGR